MKTLAALLLIAGAASIAIALREGTERIQPLRQQLDDMEARTDHLMRTRYQPVLYSRALGRVVTAAGVQ